MIYTLKNRNKGQAAAGAAVFLAILAGLLIMFIILIPPAEREKLLSETSSSSSGSGKSTDGSVSQKNLLLLNPGRIDYLAQKDIEHPLPVVNIYTKTDTSIIGEKNLAYAKKGVFVEEVSEFKFTVTDVDHTNNVLLNFHVASIKGNLIILSNGEQLFNGPVGKNANPTIPLPKNYLKAENSMVFAVSSPGLAFWRTNEVSIESIKVVGDVTNTAVQSSKHIFLISETEKSNLEKVVLKFQPQCTYVDVGKLSIIINGNEIYNGLPDCDIAMVPIEFSPALLYGGENQVLFRTEKGTYLLSHVVVLSKLKEVDFPTYYFDLSNEQYNDVQTGNRRVRLKLEFVDIVDSKEGVIVFNGNIKNFDTKEVTETIDLSSDVVQGRNSIKIKPKKTIEIRELRVDLIK